MAILNEGTERYDGPGTFVCRISRGSVPTISCIARESTVRSSDDGEIIRLDLHDITAESRSIEWNRSSGQLILRREGLWSRPLYYHIGQDEIIIADSLRATLKSLAAPLTINASGLDAYLAFEFFPAPMTPFVEIRKVGIEETCTIDLPHDSVRRQTPPLPQRIPADFESSVEQIRQAFETSLEKRANQCPSELTLFCSGGLDSTILAHLMRGRGRAVFLSYVDSWKDETVRARDTARHANLQLQVTRLPPFDVDQFTHYTSLLDEPLGGTANFAIRHLSTTIPRGSWIVGGHGSGVLSLMNVHHKRLDAARKAGPEGTLIDRFAERATQCSKQLRGVLLGEQGAGPSPHPFSGIIDCELASQSSTRLMLLAVIRRQFCVEEEMSQLWPVLDAFGHVPVMPFFEPTVYKTLDRLPESTVRDEQFERRLLKRLATLHCPNYVAQPRQLGYGLPLGVPGYPGVAEMRAAFETYQDGPLQRNGMQMLIDACEGKAGAELFELLRRLWTAVVLHSWLAQNVV